MRAGSPHTATAVHGLGADSLQKFGRNSRAGSHQSPPSHSHYSRYPHPLSPCWWLVWTQGGTLRNTVSYHIHSQSLSTTSPVSLILLYLHRGCFRLVETPVARAACVSRFKRLAWKCVLFYQGETVYLSVPCTRYSKVVCSEHERLESASN